MAAGDPRRVLVIDDDPEVRELYMLVLEKAGFMTSGAEDGLEGLAKIAVFRPDLVLLDLMMPKLSGFEVLERMKDGPHAKVPVLIVTGYSETANAEISKKAPNVVGFMPKPVHVTELPGIVAKLIAERKR